VPRSRPMPCSTRAARSTWAGRSRPPAWAGTAAGSARAGRCGRPRRAGRHGAQPAGQAAQVAHARGLT
jgi:hypothetical protein